MGLFLVPYTKDNYKELKFKLWLRLSEKFLKNLRGTRGGVVVVVFGTLYLRSLSFNFG